jgi:hypothetical protein
MLCQSKLQRVCQILFYCLVRESETCAETLVMENLLKFSQESFRKFAGKFPENPYTMFAHRFNLLILYRIIYVSGYFYCIIYVFIVLSMFRGKLPEIFITRKLSPAMTEFQ